jgi:S-adenosylmethionine:tRNA ribosyltransferase-isomerase
MNPKNISITEFRYDLPQERIAHYPLAERDSSKLLIYREGEIRQDSYRNLADHLPENTLLVFNDTKVVEARIVFQKASGGRIEIFCLEPPPEYGSITAAMLQTGKIRWKCLIGGASKWKPGQVLSRKIGSSRQAGETPEVEYRSGGDSNEGENKSSVWEGDMSKSRTANRNDESLLLEARWIGKLDDCFLIELSWSSPELSFAELLHQAGLIPLPPYIRRAAEATDQERYQTVYALYDGSVAAPTAGLHFTEAIFKNLEAKNIRKEFVTLHVGAGTFMPVKSEVLAEHTMHAEFIVVRKATIASLLGALDGLIVPVGTTSLRTIESLYWLGIKTMRNPDILPEALVVHQWDAYIPDRSDGGGDDGDNNDSNGGGDLGAGPGARPGAGEALQALLDWMNRQGLEQLLTKTQLLITPGYDWKLTGALITNFHQPESTLLLLVAALVGDEWKRIYRYAMDHEFRFLSYGDGSLLFKPISTGTPT